MYGEVPWIAIIAGFGVAVITCIQTFDPQPINRNVKELTLPGALNNGPLDY